jgi:predicted transcriptional regulator of viral defense system
VLRNITQLGPKEAEFLSRMAAFERGIFTSAKAAEYWGDRDYSKAVLYKLTKKGWIARIKRGTYLVIPLDAGPERRWSEQAVVVAQHLVHPAAVAYWSALHHWRLTEQVPRVMFVQTPKRRSRRDVEALGMHFRLVTIAQAKFFGLMTQDMGGRPVTVTDREKTLIDAADRPELSGGIVQLAEALRQGASDIDWPRLDAHLARFGVGTIYKRLGYLVEILDIGMPHVEERLASWQSRLTAGISPLEPGSKNGGPTVTRWRIRVNVRGFEEDNS